MSARSSGGRVLIASNRGPLSFTLGDNGQLTAGRGGGGMVSGLSSVGERGGRAVGLRRAQRRGPGRRPRRARRAAGPGRHAGRFGGAAARHPGSGLRRGLQRGGEFGPLVHPSHALRHAEPAGVRHRVPPRLGILSCLQRRIRRGAGRRRRPRGQPVPDPGGGPGLSPLAGPAHARRPAPRHQDRAFLAHPVGAAGLLPDTAGSGRPRGTRRHTRRRSRRVPEPALGRLVPRLLRAGSSVPRWTGEPGG